MDRLDPNPMRFILNDRFIDILGKIEVLSNGYSMGSDIKYPVGKEKWYVFMFLRKFNPNYDKNLWNGTLSCSDLELMKFFRKFIAIDFANVLYTKLI